MIWIHHLPPPIPITSTLAVTAPGIATTSGQMEQALRPAMTTRTGIHTATSARATLGSGITPKDLGRTPTGMQHLLNQPCPTTSTPEETATGIAQVSNPTELAKGPATTRPTETRTAILAQETLSSGIIPPGRGPTPTGILPQLSCLMLHPPTCILAVTVPGTVAA